MADEVTSFQLNLGDRQRALIQLGEPHFEAHLAAIKCLLRRNEEADRQVAEKMDELAEQLRNTDGGNQEGHAYLGDYYADEAFHAGFQDAAHSMAAVGMLAPLVESLFVAIFNCLQDLNRDKKQAPNDDPRIAATEEQFWDPHYEFRKNRRRRDIVAGIRQLGCTTGLSDHMPSHLDSTISALFAYRNMMFHNGFEWSNQKGREFKNRIRSEDWPSNWFTESWRNENFRLFYMSPDFVQHCLQTVDLILDGFGAYLNSDNS